MPLVAQLLPLTPILLLLSQPFQHLPLPRNPAVHADSRHQLLRGCRHGRPGQHACHLPGGGQQRLCAHVCVWQPGCRQPHQQWGRGQQQQQRWQWWQWSQWWGQWRRQRRQQQRSRHLRDPRWLHAGQCQPVLLPHHPCLTSHCKYQPWSLRRQVMETPADTWVAWHQSAQMKIAWGRIPHCVASDKLFSPSEPQLMCVKLLERYPKKCHLL